MLISVDPDEFEKWQSRPSLKNALWVARLLRCVYNRAVDSRPGKPSQTRRSRLDGCGLAAGYLSGVACFFSENFNPARSQCIGSHRRHDASEDNELEIGWSCSRRRGLIAARQAHSEHCFSLLGTHVDLAPMRPGNFAYDIQSEPEAIVGIVALRRASL